MICHGCWKKQGHVVNFPFACNTSSATGPRCCQKLREVPHMLLSKCWKRGPDLSYNDGFDNTSNHSIECVFFWAGMLTYNKEQNTTHISMCLHNICLTTSLWGSWFDPLWHGPTAQLATEISRSKTTDSATTWRSGTTKEHTESRVADSVNSILSD